MRPRHVLPEPYVVGFYRSKKGESYSVLSHTHNHILSINGNRALWEIQSIIQFDYKHHYLEILSPRLDGIDPDHRVLLSTLCDLFNKL